MNCFIIATLQSLHQQEVVENLKKNDYFFHLSAYLNDKNAAKNGNFWGNVLTRNHPWFRDLEEVTSWGQKVSKIYSEMVLAEPQNIPCDH